jgi:hypothetical protein
MKFQDIIIDSNKTHQPVFHPVAENTFPALPIVIVLSYIPGKLAKYL